MSVADSPATTAVRRAGVVGRHLTELVTDKLAADGFASVLDCGGGSGRYAVPLALAGATVTVVDTSADALSTLRTRSIEAGVADRVVPVQADVESLSAALPVGSSFDVVLAHGVLEAVDRVQPAFSAMVAMLAPGGALSVLVTNPSAAVFARALAGELAGALHELDAAERSDRGPEAVARLCTAADLRLDRVAGVGVFRDLVPGAALEAPGAAAALEELEARCAQRTPFAQLASQVHLVARRPSASSASVPGTAPSASAAAAAGSGDGP